MSVSLVFVNPGVAGLVPATHVFLTLVKPIKDVDDRDKPGQGAVFGRSACFRTAGLPAKRRRSRFLARYLDRVEVLGRGRHLAELDLLDRRDQLLVGRYRQADRAAALDDDA